MTSMSRTQVWLKAFRLHTLPLALACIAMGNFIAYANHTFHPLIAALTFLTAILLQVLSNLANDYGDTKHGADSTERVGPVRMVQSGMITRQQIKAGVVIFSILSFATGIGLITVSVRNIGYQGAMVLLVVGLLSIAAAIAYTATKRPYGYRGLGDLSVFIFFGIVAVLGSYYLQAGNIPGILSMPAAAMGFLSTAVLNVNNVRDIEADLKANKVTIAAKLGLRYAKIYHWSLLMSALALFFLYSFNVASSLADLAFLLPGVLFIINGIGISKSTQPSEINPYLKQLVLSILLFTLVYGIGLIIYA